MPGIFEIEDELVRIAEAFDALEAGEESIEVLAAVEGYFARLLSDRDAKVDGYCRLIADYQGKAKVKKAEADRLAAAAKADENAAERLKGRLKLFMEANAMVKLEGALHKVAIQPNGGKIPLVVDEDVDLAAVAAFDPSLVRTVVQLDADAVRGRLEEIENRIAERTIERELDLQDEDPSNESIERNAEIASKVADFEKSLRAEVGLPFARLGERGTHVRIR